MSKVKAANHDTRGKVKGTQKQTRDAKLSFNSPPREIINPDNIKPIDESQDLGDYEEPQKLSKYSLV